MQSWSRGFLGYETAIQGQSQFGTRLSMQEIREIMPAPHCCARCMVLHYLGEPRTVLPYPQVPQPLWCPGEMTIFVSQPDILGIVWGFTAIPTGAFYFEPLSVSICFSFQLLCLRLWLICLSSLLCILQLSSCHSLQQSYCLKQAPQSSMGTSITFELHLLCSTVAGFLISLSFNL